MSNAYKIRPSELIGIDCVYTAYCFDKACLYISQMMAPTYDDKGKQKQGKVPVFPSDKIKSHEDNDGLQMLLEFNNKSKRG